MANREDIMDVYIRQFSADRSVALILDKNKRVTDEDIQKTIIKVNQEFDSVPGIPLSKEDEEELIRRIKSEYAIYQEEGSVILGDYDHDYKWYENLLSDKSFDQYYWNRYKGYLFENKKFPEAVLNTLEHDTLFNLMSYIGNPTEEDTTFSFRGLVVGDVQSGKTSNYIGLMTKAADAGYKVIFVLTGTIESLRRQTQERIEDGFVGFDSVEGMDVGIGRGTRMPKTYTSRKKDFTGADDQNTTYQINDGSAEPRVFVLKKNVSVLKKVYATLKKQNTRFNNEKINCSMLLIDDEADNASINTNKPDTDPTKINEQIRKILSLFTKTTYVGFTATPFANVFITYDSEDDMINDDLFPKDFIYALHAPSNYCGSRKYFFTENKNVVHITDDNQTVFPMKHKKDYQVKKLYPSVYEAVNCFIIANAIRDTYDSNINTHRSMMINMSRFTAVQELIADEIGNYISDMKKHIRQSFRLIKELRDKNRFMISLKTTFDDQFADNGYNHQEIDWEEIVPNLYDAIKDIKVITVNSSKNSTKLDYEKYKETGLRVIAVGGLALSRGLTLEGLCTSYFYRNTSTYDVLMQMGRWFGYRDNYGDICRIFITEKSEEYYRIICEAIEQLKQDIDEMGKQKKRPEDYGIRVMSNSSELGITARNKMRDTSLKIDRKDFYGNFFETPYLYRDVEINDRNIKATEDFLSRIPVQSRDFEVTNPYFRNIDENLVVELLSKIRIHDASMNFDTFQLRNFIRKEKNELFDVVLIGGSSEKRYINERLGINMKMVNRYFDVRAEEEVIRVSGQRAHLIGPADAKNGLDKKHVIEERNPKAQDFMIEGRNPLLAIYYFEPDYRKEKIVNEYDRRTSEKLIDDLSKAEFDYLVGYCIFFPKNSERSTGEFYLYTVNNSVNYYDKIHEEDIKYSFEESEGEEDDE